MIIPWGTDAPIYHRPIATIGLIVVNVARRSCCVPGAEYEEWTLVLGDGMHPLQWVTNIFLHSGFFHLAGNMIFLWTFGLVVEGKLGWWAFLLVYLGLGVCESAGMQFLVHSEHPVHMLGSSAIIFGLLAMCLVWAPMNEVVCIVWLRFTPSVFDLSILWFAAATSRWTCSQVELDGRRDGERARTARRARSSRSCSTTPSARSWASFVAVALLKLGWVDCENWDLFAVLEGRKGQSKAAAEEAKSRIRWCPRRVSPTQRSATAGSERARSRRRVRHSVEDAGGRRVAGDAACISSWARSRRPWPSINKSSRSPAGLAAAGVGLDRPDPGDPGRRTPGTMRSGDARLRPDARPSRRRASA